MKAQPNLGKHLLPWLMLFVGFGAVFLPTFVDLFRTLWSTDQNAHGPIVLVVAVWFFYFKAKGIVEAGEFTPKPAKVAGSLTILLGLLMYVAGRSQSVYVLEVGAIVPLLAGCVLIYFGTAICKRLWFAFFFLCFMIPLPGSVVDALTQPMKIAVSYATEHILYWLGYPIARNGVILMVGQYQLLVADACAGLNSLFTLEALGLLYMNVMRHESPARNTILAILIVPISMSSNVIRVIILALVTYHFGDEVGQGFVHGFSGMVLFVTALMLIIGVDSLLRAGVNRVNRTAAA
ncbi:exosortase_2, exosortase B [Comamonadaceae bacterium]